MESHGVNQDRLLHRDDVMDAIQGIDFQVVPQELMHRNMQVDQGDRLKSDNERTSCH